MAVSIKLYLQKQQRAGLCSRSSLPSPVLEGAPMAAQGRFSLEQVFKFLCWSHCASRLVTCFSLSSWGKKTSSRLHPFCQGPFPNSHSIKLQLLWLSWLLQVHISLSAVGKEAKMLRTCQWSLVRWLQSSWPRPVLLGPARALLVLLEMQSPHGLAADTCPSFTYLSGCLPGWAAS